MGHNYLKNDANLGKIGDAWKLHRISNQMPQTELLYIQLFRNDKQTKIATSSRK